MYECTLSLKLRYESSVMPKCLTEATGPGVWPDRPRSKYWHFLFFIIDVSDDTAVNFPTEELFSARMMSLRASTTHDHKPSNLMAAQWCRARVKNARGNSFDRIVGRKPIKEKYVLFVNTLSHFAISSFKRVPFILLP